MANAWVRLALAFILSGAPAEPTAGAEEPGEVFRLVLVASPDDPLASAAAAELAGLPVDFLAEEIVAPGKRSLPEQLAAISEVANMTGADLVAWFDVDDQGRGFLYVSEPKGGGTLVRELPRESGTAQTDRAAAVLRETVAKTLEGGRLGVEAPPEEPEPEPEAEAQAEPEPEPEAEPEPEPKPEAEPDPKPERRKIVVDLAAAYGLEGFSPQRSIGHSIVVGADLWFGAHVMSSLRFRGTVPTTVTDQGIELRLFRYPVELSVRGVARLGKMDVGGGVVFVLEVMERRARPTFEGVEVEPSPTWVRGALGPVVQVGWQAHERVRLWVDLGADVHLLPVEHVVTGGDEPLLAPFTVRPRAQLGLAIALNPPKAAPRPLPRRL